MQLGAGERTMELMDPVIAQQRPAPGDEGGADPGLFGPDSVTWQVIACILTGAGRPSLGPVPRSAEQPPSVRSARRTPKTVEPPLPVPPVPPMAEARVRSVSFGNVLRKGDVQMRRTGAVSDVGVVAVTASRIGLTQVWRWEGPAPKI